MRFRWASGYKANNHIDKVEGWRVLEKVPLKFSNIQAGKSVQAIGGEETCISGGVTLVGGVGSFLGLLWGLEGDILRGLCLGRVAGGGPTLVLPFFPCLLLELLLEGELKPVGVSSGVTDGLGGDFRLC